jgi:hypothetical protein
MAYTGAVNPTPNVGFTWEPYFPRLVSRTDGAGTTQFTYVPVGSLGALQVQQESGPFANSAITSAYDMLVTSIALLSFGQWLQHRAYKGVNGFNRCIA